MKNISSKFLMVLLLVAGLPLILSSLVNINSTRHSLVDESLAALNAIADYRVKQIEDYLDYQENLIKLTAKAPLIGNAFERLSAAFALGPDSDEYRRIDEELRQYLEYFGETSRFADVYLIGADGDVMFSLQRKADFGSNLIDGPYADSPLADSFNLAVTMFGANFTGYHPYELSDGEYSAFFSVPIFARGFPVGTVSAQLGSDALYAFSRDYTGLSRSGEVMLGKLDIDTVLLVAPLRHDEDAAFQRRIATGLEPAAPLELAARGDHGSSEHVDYRGIEAISAWRYLPKLQWGMVVKVDRNEVLAAGQQLVEHLIFEVLISLAAVLLVAFLLSRWLSRPITRLLAATRKVAAGELDHRVAYHSGDEIGELAASFNDMTEKLKTSLQRAEAAATAKTRFLTTMSHEIRTPMNGVLGMAQLLEDTDLSAEQRDYLDTMLRSGDNLLSIVNNILDFSKLDKVAVNLENIRFDLEALGKECLEPMLPKAAEKQLQLVLDYQLDAPAFFIGDPARLRQVIVNFVGNAIKFTDSGYVRLAVACRQHDEIAQLEIDVEDTGIGIEQDKQAHLFEEFFQADQSTSRRYGGTGLGLAISKTLVDLMGGQIEISSQVGRGSRFRISLELPLGGETAGGSASHLVGHRVLLADDGGLDIDLLQRQLGHFGMQVMRIAADADIVEHLRGAAARGEPCGFAIFGNRRDPDADIDMASRIRRHQEFDELRLAVFAPGGHQSNAGRYQRAGVDAYLSKLSSRHDLLTILTALLGKPLRDPMITHFSVRDLRRINEPPGQLRGRVLVVEDAPTNQLIVQKILTSLGLEVDLVENGQQAVDALDGSAYDLVLMDCLMPVMDGYDATRRIRETENADRRTTIIALTANASEEDARRCISAGMDDIVTKPFRKSDLVACLSRHLAPLHSRAS